MDLLIFLPIYLVSPSVALSPLYTLNYSNRISSNDNYYYNETTWRLADDFRFTIFLRFFGLCFWNLSSLRNNARVIFRHKKVEWLRKTQSVVQTCIVALCIFLLVKVKGLHLEKSCYWFLENFEYHYFFTVKFFKYMAGSTGYSNKNRQKNCQLADFRIFSIVEQIFAK